jgi:hypothetical protein
MVSIEEVGWLGEGRRRRGRKGEGRKRRRNKIKGKKREVKIKNRSRA